MSSRVSVAMFPGQGLDVFRMLVIDQDDLADAMVKWFGARSVDAELVSPVHALYRPSDPQARNPTWFVMVREDANTGRLVDLSESDARELPRMLRNRTT